MSKKKDDDLITTPEMSNTDFARALREAVRRGLLTVTKDAEGNNIYTKVKAN